MSGSIGDRFVPVSSEPLIGLDRSHDFKMRGSRGTVPLISVADPGGPRGPCPPWPVKNRPKKDGRSARRLIFHVSCPPPLSEVSGSATEFALVS